VIRPSEPASDSGGMREDGKKAAAAGLLRLTGNFNILTAAAISL